MSALTQSSIGPVLKKDVPNAGILFVSKYVTAVHLWGHLEQTETVMWKKTEDEPQNLLMNLRTQQILLIWQIDLLELHPIPAIATHDVHMKNHLKVSHQHIPVDDMYD